VQQPKQRAAELMHGAFIMLFAERDKLHVPKRRIYQLRAFSRKFAVFDPKRKSAVRLQQLFKRIRLCIGEKTKRTNKRKTTQQFYQAHNFSRAETLAPLYGAG
jgi:hypothetical protein